MGDYLKWWNAMVHFYVQILCDSHGLTIVPCGQPGETTDAANGHVQDLEWNEKTQRERPTALSVPSAVISIFY